ncbi:hypothetical protein [Streptomyces sp. NPDC049744]|uniref:hypothetical protein n=1 Tax=Streptomyces sp. NPDC049744 TaxID=3154359 RepID=UPI0034191E11
MTLDIRATSDPNHFDLYEGEEKVGELVSYPDTDEDGTVHEDSPWWHGEVWSQMGTGRTFNGDTQSFEEAKQYAHEMYEEMVAERRELSKGSRPRTISTPMGGQRRK